MIEDFVIRKAELKDLESLFNLYQYWDENEFHFKNKYTKEILLKIISEIAVAMHNDEVVSFYFINPFLDIGNLEQRKKIIPQLIKEERLPDGRYAYCLLSATHKDYFGKGLNKQTLNLLRKLSKGDYDYFIGIMYYDNIATQQSSLKMGWKHFGDIGIGLLAVIGTTDERNDLLKP